MKARHGAIGALVAVSLLGAACSDDDAAPTTTTAPVGVLARGEGTLEGALAGTAPIELHYAATVASCPDLVALPAFVVPLPTQLADAVLAWEAATPKLHGAGTYHLSDFGIVRVTVTREGAEPVVYTSGPDATADLQVDAAAGGTFTFAGLHDPAGAELHGTSTWTCGPGA